MSYNKDLRVLLFKRQPEKLEEEKQDVNIEPPAQADIPEVIEQDEIGNDIDLLE